MKMQPQKKLLIVSATEFEILPLLDYLNKNYERKANFFRSKNLDIHLLISGVGSVSTTFHLSSFLAQNQIDLAINLGIAGAFNRSFKLGQVFQVHADCFADIGIEQADGSFQDLFDMQLLESSEAPFVNKKLYSNMGGFKLLPEASALTVHKVSGTTESIRQLQSKYAVDLESMEGAAFYYCCNMHQIDALQIRSVSNFVEPRNKENWNIPLAIDELNKVAIEILQTMNE